MLHHGPAVYRSTRCSDLDTCSKWAALSFFENDPKRIRHHLDILKVIDNQDMLDSLVRRAQREQRLTAVCPPELLLYAQPLAVLKLSEPHTCSSYMLLVNLF